MTIAKFRCSNIICKDLPQKSIFDLKDLPRLNPTVKHPSHLMVPLYINLSRLSTLLQLCTENKLQMKHIALD